MDKFSDYGIEIPYRRTSGQVKCICPKCHDRRSNKHDRSLSVNLELGVWHCHYCNWSGNLDGYKKPSQAPRKTYARPQDKPQGGYSDKMLGYFASRGISEAVMRSVGVGEGTELMPPSPKSGKNEWRNVNTVQFKYYLEGELVNIKYRTGDKVFKLCKDAELIPYNLDSAKDQDTVIITEGEFDCLSFVEAGFVSVVSVPNGASSNTGYLDEFIEGWFDDKRIIYIASDTDSKGIELQKELVRRFGEERCKLVTYGDGCKDANEHLMRYGKDSLRACVSSAKDVPIEGVYTVDDFRDKFLSLYRNGLSKGNTIGFDNLDELVTWETGRLCVMSGYPSGGKSSFINELCVRLNLLYGWKSVFFSPESCPIETHYAVLCSLICGKSFNTTHLSSHELEQAMDYLADNFSVILPPNGNKLDYILQRAEAEVKRKGVKIVVIDPYNTLESEQGNKSETLYISEVLDKLSSFARRLDVLFILAAHPSKPDKGTSTSQIPTLSQISGSMHFWNKADYGVVVHRYKDNEEETRNYTVIDVQKVKMRNLGEGGRCYFKFNRYNGRFVPYDPDNPAMLNMNSWDNRNYLECNINQVTIENADLLNSIRVLETTIGESDIPF